MRHKCIIYQDICRNDIWIVTYRFYKKHLTKKGNVSVETHSSCEGIIELKWLNHQWISHFVLIVFNKIKDEFPPLSGGVGGIKNLADNKRMIRPNQIKSKV